MKRFALAALAALTLAAGVSACADSSSPTAPARQVAAPRGGTLMQDTVPQVTSTTTTEPEPCKDGPYGSGAGTLLPCPK